MSDSFRDTRIILTRPGDKRLCFFCHREHRVSFEQAHDGPRFLVIGHHAHPNAIRRAAARYNLNPDTLLSWISQEEAPSYV